MNLWFSFPNKFWYNSWVQYIVIYVNHGGRKKKGEKLYISGKCRFSAFENYIWMHCEHALDQQFTNLTACGSRLLINLCDWPLWLRNCFPDGSSSKNMWRNLAYHYYMGKSFNVLRLHLTSGRNWSTWPHMGMSTQTCLNQKLTVRYF